MTNVTKQFLSQAEFVSLPVDKREKLREVFGISKSGQVKVQTTSSGNDVLVSDGTESQDLLNSVNLKSVLTFLGREFKEKAIYEFDALFQEVLAKLFPNEPIKVETPKEVPIVLAPLKNEEKKDETKKGIVVTQKRGRPKKNG